MSFISYLLFLCLLSGTFVGESEATSPEAKSEPNKDANRLGGGDNPEENNGTFRDRLNPVPVYPPMYQGYPQTRREPDKEMNSLGDDVNGTSVRDRINPGAMYPPTYQGYPNYPSYPSQPGNGFGTYFQNGCTCPGGNTGYNPQQYNPMYPYPYNGYNGFPFMYPQGQDQFGYNSGTSRTEKASSPVVNP
ncbi:uncharacterized protein [Macrobrachium rosenbergii]|uniref:uncharacterized protein n=1 Tax=Macrobrachium rosenbergii TaxID=79674 RepID=UPI0034D5C272